MHTNGLIIVDSQAPSAAIRPLDSLEVAIQAWLHNKKQHSGSDRTERAYRTTLDAFRQHLQSKGLDLDSETDLTLYLQVWADQGRPRAKADQDKGLSRATFNQRLAVVSSFYKFAARRKYLSLPNPAEGIERGSVQAFGKAEPLNTEIAKTKLQGINRNTLAGQRDYILLHIALNTGRRRAELAGLRVGDLRQEDEQIVVTWRRTKGGETAHNLLPKRLSAALLRYLEAVHGKPFKRVPPEAPVWIALAPVHYGHALTTQAIADICLKHLGTSKVHTTRHTFAHEMERVGARVTEIQASLGHKHLGTTNAYLKALASAYNPHADELADLFGAEED